MAIDKLGIYNNALIGIGSTVLTTITDDRDERYSLDAAYDLDAEDRLLDIIKPRFASTTVALTGAATAGGITLAFTHTLPADFVAIVGVYSDAELDQPVNRYMHQGSTILCDYDTVYLRYIHNTITEADYTSTFGAAFSAFLAEAICLKYNKSAYDVVLATKERAIEEAISTDGIKEPDARPATAGSALSEDWRKIYNGALQILATSKIPSGTDDHFARVALDTAVEAKAVENVMEDTGWQFGSASVKLDADPDIEPSWGFRYAFTKPADLHRFDGLFLDEYMSRPLTRYADQEGNYWTTVDVIYLKYISTVWLTQPASWPAFFSRLISARIAKDAAGEINPGRQQYADAEYKERLSSAMSNDAVQSPPIVISEGSWIRSRNTSLYSRSRRR